MTDTILEQLNNLIESGGIITTGKTEVDYYKAAAARIFELMAERDKANQSTKDWLRATADEKLETRRLNNRIKDLISEGLMLVGKIEQRDARIAELEALLKECADDLAAELDGRDRIMPDNKVHPAMQHRYDRDMAPVRAARAALGEKE